MVKAHECLWRSGLFGRRVARLSFWLLHAARRSTMPLLLRGPYPDSHQLPADTGLVLPVPRLLQETLKRVLKAVGERFEGLEDDMDSQVVNK